MLFLNIWHKLCFMLVEAMKSYPSKNWSLVRIQPMPFRCCSSVG